MSVFLITNRDNGITFVSPDFFYVQQEGFYILNDDDALDITSAVRATVSIAGDVFSSDGRGITMNTVPRDQTQSNRVIITDTGTVLAQEEGVYLTGADNQINISGSVTSTISSAIRISGESAKINNTGTVDGVFAAISMESDFGEITNSGTLLGDRYGIESTGDNALINHAGLIMANEGVRLGGDNVRFVNTGDIQVRDSGVLSRPEFTSGREIRIENYGTITVGRPSGEAFAIQGNEADEWVTNEGEIRGGDVVLRNGADTYRSLEGRLDGALDMGSGDDTVILGDGTLERLVAFDAGSGSDTLDLSAFSHAVWVDLALSAAEVWTRDGADLQAGSGQWRAIVDAEALENVIGTRGVDQMHGNGADNTFTFVGNGNQGAVESVNGRGGSDTIDFSRAQSAVWVDLVPSAGGGWTQGDEDATDTATAENPWQQLTLLAGIENITGTFFTDYMAGDNADNRFGFDTGIGGIEVINGRSGSDTVDFSDARYAVWVDLGFAGNEVWTQNSSGIALSGDPHWFEVGDLISVENMIGSRGGDILRGDAGANVISGGAGEDILSGAGGFDTFVFEGEWGTDTITDFNSDNSERIDLADVASITSFGDLVSSHARNAADGTLEIYDPFDNVIRLDGYSLADLHAGGLLSEADFIF